MLSMLRSAKTVCALAFLLIFSYAFVSSSAQFHRHDAGNVLAQTTDQTDSTDAQTPGFTSADCELCDFAALPLTAPPAVETPSLARFVAVPVLVPAERPAPFIPIRFCDRSAARAPPAA